MKIYFWLPIVIFWACHPAQRPDLILYNGNIHTMVSPSDRVSAIGIQNGKIIATGNDLQVLQLKTPMTQLIDLHQAFVLPGFTDAHIHPISGGLALLECNLTDLTSRNEILDSLKNYAIHHPEKEWIRGENMWLAAFPRGNALALSLDSIIPDRPVYISSSDGHNAWVNTKALQMAYLSRETPDPEHGRIERDAQGNPSGTLRESAMNLVRQHLPAYSDKDRRQALLTAIQQANQFGLTSLNEANAHPDDVRTYLELAKENKLNAHINISLACDISKGLPEAQRVISLRDSLKAVHTDVYTNEVKLFMDGVVEGKTAAMLANYSDDHQKGIANASADMASNIIMTLDRAGLQVHVHSIGDRATRMTLDAFEYALSVNGKRDSRHHIAHLHVVDPADYDRFRTLNVIANFQSLWATWEDTYMTELNKPFLGKERMELQYPMGTLLRHGATLAFGSDWDVSTQNPFMAMQVAVTRRGPDSMVRSAWTPQHLIDRYNVIKGYTRNGAYLTFREKETGTIEKGKWADILVLDQDILHTDVFKIYKTKVLTTYYKGQIVYEYLQSH